LPQFVNPVRAEVEKRVRLRLGIPDTQALPADVQGLVTDAANAATAKALEVAVGREADTAIQNVYRPAQLKGFQDKVAVARAGIDVIAQSPDVDGILQRRAELLKKKKDALVTAKFTEKEAMEILLADIAHQG